MPEQTPIKRYRRYHGYDYARGAYLFVTTSLSPRRPLLGQVTWASAAPLPPAACEGRPPRAICALSPAGLAVQRALLETPRHVPGIALKQCVVMPDHVHALLYVAPGLAAPLKALGRFMAGFKRVAAKDAGVKWERGYHDRVCIGADFRAQVAAYIAQNPLKWALMHGGANDGVCRVKEPLAHPALNEIDYWRGLGALALLDGKICSIRVSRKVAALTGAQRARFLKGAGMGYVFISTFLSPGERELYALLAENGGRMIAVKERGLGLVYRPDVNETPLLAAGRLAILGLGGRLADSQPSRAAPGSGEGHPAAARDGRASPGPITRAGSLLLNDKIAAIARASGGAALYLTPAGLTSAGKR